MQYPFWRGGTWCFCRVHVAYGVLGLKTHAKLCLIVRQEQDRLQYYVHMGTGNYNHVTSRMYTDLGCVWRYPWGVRKLEATTSAQEHHPHHNRSSG